MFTAMLVMAAMSASVAHAYDPSMSAEKAMKAVAKTDCAASPAECRYYATVEYVSYFEACRTAIEKSTGRRLTDVQWKPNADLVSNWSVFKDEKLKTAVMDSNNPLKAKLIKQNTAKLVKMRADLQTQECERIALVGDDFSPEQWASILKPSVNYATYQATLVKQ